MTSQNLSLLICRLGILCVVFFPAYSWASMHPWNLAWVSMAHHCQGQALAVCLCFIQSQAHGICSGNDLGAVLLGVKLYPRLKCLLKQFSLGLVPEKRNQSRFSLGGLWNWGGHTPLCSSCWDSGFLQKTGKVARIL